MRIAQSSLLSLLLVLCSSAFLQAQLVADFSGNNTTGCRPFPLVVSFTDLSTGNPTSWSWDFGDGSGTSSIQNPTYTYNLPGCYDVTLTVDDGTGSNSITQTCFVEVFAQPIPDFSVDLQEGCAPLTVNFSDNSIANATSITDWLWILSDGSNSTDQNPSFDFLTAPDTINVILQITNSNGCQNTLIGNTPIIVLPPPSLDFSVDVNSSCNAPLTVNYTNNSQTNGANNVTFNWSFPGGSPSTFQGINPPSVTYNSDGQYDATLILNSQNGCNDTLLMTDIVGIGGVTASFTASSTIVCIGEPIIFDNTSLGGVTSLGWDFGENPGIDASTALVTYTYSTPGTYSVTLQANNAQCGDTIVQSNLITVLDRPTASFTVDHLQDCQPGIPYTFSDQSTGTDSWFWDFGDSLTTSTAQNPTHTFNSFGTYDVCLIASNSQGCSDTTCTTITIAPPTASFGLNPSEGCAPLMVSLTDQSNSSDPIISWDWDLGSSTAVPQTSTQQNPTVTYPDSGSYDISLIILTASGCTDTLNLNNIVEVGLPPQVDFIADKDTVCINEAVTFTSLFTNPNWEYFWDFYYESPGIFVELADTATTIYPDSGTYSVGLIINNNGCRDTLIQNDLIFVSPPRAQFLLSDTLVCSLPNTVTITDMALGPVNVYEWYVNNALYSTLPNPPALPIDTIGSYLVTQIVTNTLSGCSDTLSQLINAGNPTANFFTLDTLGCRSHIVNYVDLSQNYLVNKWILSLLGSSTQLSGTNPVFTYPDTGTYTVQLLLLDNIGCRDTMTRVDYIRVIGPYADFDADPTIVCPGTPIGFMDSSVTTAPATITAWEWDFGDGSPPSFTQNTNHTYDSTGFYSVNLTVTDDTGCMDSILKQNFVEIPVPTPIFTVDDSSTCLGNNITITDNSIGNGLIYFWDFGDGVGTDSVPNPSYTYTDTGFFDITLILENSTGCRDTLVQPNAVYIEYLEARFGGDPLVGICPPLSTQFADSSIGNIQSWNWSFGDQFGISTLQDPGYVYLAPGSYTVELVIAHEDGCQDTLTKQDYVFVAGPNGTFTISEEDACLGDTICIEAIASAASCASFDFRDGFFTTECGLSGGSDTIQYCYVYTTPGTYSPVVVLEDPQGCVFTLTTTDSVSIHPHPETMMMPQDTAGCAPFEVTFTETTQLADTTIANWTWILGDGDTSFLPSPIKTFTGDSIYNLSLYIEDGFGCTDTAMTTLTVYQGSIPGFIADDTVGCAPANITFSDQSTNIPATAWTWIFGDGNTITGDSNPIHTYDQDGLYTVTLIISDGLGCSDTLTKTNYINLRHPEAVVYGSQSNACNPVTLTFYADSSIVEGDPVSYEWCLTNVGTGQVDCYNTSRGEDSLELDFLESGDFEITLSLFDSEGCEDTSEPFAVSIIARVTPDPIEVRNVSVVNDQSVEVFWAPYPGTDFVEYLIYRIEGTNPVEVATISNINTTFFRENNPNLDCSENSYCYKVLVRNTCDEVSLIGETLEHCTIDLETSPGIDAINLTWTPYVGYLVGQYEIYLTDSYTPTNPPILLDIVAGNTLSYTDTNTFCYDSISYRILAVGFNGQEQRSFSDIDANAPDHPLPVENVDIRTATVVQDSFIIVNWSAYTGYLPDYYILQKSGDGQSWAVVDSFPLDIQTYTDTAVSVDDQSYYYRVFAIDECEDRSVEGLFGQSILLKSELRNGKTPLLFWSDYLEWPLGVINYQIEVFNESTQEFEVVDVVGNSTTNFLDNLTRLNQDTYCYRIHAYEAGGAAEAISNEVCLIFHSRFYVPNAFTPNNDGNNDSFRLVGISLAAGEISIFDRWGELVYRSFNLDDAWDGTHNGKAVQEGVYVYSVSGVGLDGITYTQSGTVTLIR